MHVLALSMLAPFTFIMPAVAKVHQGTQTLMGLKDYIGPSPAIASRWSSLRHVFFTAESYYAVATVTAFDEDSGLIYKHDITSLILSHAGPSLIHQTR